MIIKQAKNKENKANSIFLIGYLKKKLVPFSAAFFTEEKRKKITLLLLFIH